MAVLMGLGRPILGADATRARPLVPSRPAIHPVAPAPRPLRRSSASRPLGREIMVVRCRMPIGRRSPRGWRAPLTALVAWLALAYPPAAQAEGADSAERDLPCEAHESSGDLRHPDRHRSSRRVPQSPAFRPERASHRLSPGQRLDRDGRVRRGLRAGRAGVPHHGRSDDRPGIRDHHGWRHRSRGHGDVGVHLVDQPVARRHLPGREDEPLGRRADTARRIGVGPLHVAVGQERVALPGARRRQVRLQLQSQVRRGRAQQHRAANPQLRRRRPRTGRPPVV